jgi:hypothetical protein
MIHPLEKIFEEAVEQASDGKGEERHGNGKCFMTQPWVSLADTHGTGFLTGQAQKKIMEAVKNKEATNYLWYKREMLGAINYLAMALLYEERIDDGRH